jgi:hypothetical protein
MSTKRVATLAWVTAALCACGGGASDPAPSANPPQTASLSEQQMSGHWTGSLSLLSSSVKCINMPVSIAGPRQQEITITFPSRELMHAEFNPPLEKVGAFTEEQWSNFSRTNFATAYWGGDGFVDWLFDISEAGKATLTLRFSKDSGFIPGGCGGEIWTAAMTRSAS